MAKTIKQLGIRKYLDDVYQKEGGFERYAKIRFELKWPQKAAEDEFGITRETIRAWDLLAKAELGIQEVPA